MANAYRECGISIFDERFRPVSQRIEFEASSIPDVAKIGSCDFQLPKAESPYTGMRVIVLAPQGSTYIYDQSELDNLGSLVQNKVTANLTPVNPKELWPKKAKRKFDPRSLCLPQMTYDEELKPIQTVLPGYAATLKGRKSEICRTMVILSPDRELGELVLLFWKRDLKEIEKLIVRNATNHGQTQNLNESDFEGAATLVYYGMEQLSVGVPKDWKNLIKESMGKFNKLPLESLANKRRSLYLTAALNIGLNEGARAAINPFS